MDCVNPVVLIFSNDSILPTSFGDAIIFRQGNKPSKHYGRAIHEPSEIDMNSKFIKKHAMLVILSLLSTALYFLDYILLGRVSSARRTGGPTII